MDLVSAHPDAAPAAFTPVCGRLGAQPLCIEARGLGLVFPAAAQPIVALTGIDLSIARGEFVSFIGPSGCGKTTLLRAIADLERPTDGILTVNGLIPAEARLQHAYGYVFQAPALYPWRNIERNVMLPLELFGVGREERRARAAHYLALVGLSGFARHFPWQLSGGMQQRASIARALSFKPELLLMDEPFGALDEITRDSLNLHLHRLWRQSGMTVVFVTHSISEAVFLSTRIVVMSPRPGRIVEIIPSELPCERDTAMRETPAFLAIAKKVRAALRAGHAE